jgi:hypothetical protein
MNTLAWFSAGLFVLGQAAAPESEADLKEVLYPYYAREAAEYEFFLDAKHEQKLQFYNKPVMKWTNADKYMGAVFVWIEKSGAWASPERTTSTSPAKWAQ